MFNNVTFSKTSFKLLCTFRDAAECAPKFGDRKTYQVPYTNAREAMMEVEFDVNEGSRYCNDKARIILLGFNCRNKKEFNIPVAAYSVSENMRWSKLHPN